MLLHNGGRRNFQLESPVQFSRVGQVQIYVQLQPAFFSRSEWPIEHPLCMLRLVLAQVALNHLIIRFYRPFKGNQLQEIR